ncbi:MAG: hypothetical protein AB8G26_16415, partial [Ilumatobacter sp.]
MNDRRPRRLGVAVIVVAVVGVGAIALAAGDRVERSESSSPGRASQAAASASESEPTEELLQPRAVDDVRDETPRIGEPRSVEIPGPPATTAPLPSTTLPPVTAPPLAEQPAVVARPVPSGPPPTPPTAPRAPWADSVFTTLAGQVSTDVGCAADRSAEGLDEFFAERVGPVLGWAYQHV